MTTRKPRLGSIYRRKHRLPDGQVVESGPYWIKYHVGGQVFRESSKSERYADAERLLAKRLGELSTGAFQGLHVEKTLTGELLDDVLSEYRMNGKAVRFAENCINNHLRPYFGARRAAAVTTAAARKYVEFRKGSDQGTRRYQGRLAKPKQIPILPGTNATINRELALLKHAFYLGWRHTPRKVANVPYIPLLEEKNTRKGFFEHDQFIAMRTALPEHLKAALTFAYYTGCRRGEILSLQWAQIDLVERVVRLEPGTTKNAEARNLPLTTELFEVLSMQRSVRDTKWPACPWVFFNESGERIGQFRRSWATACKAAGLVRGEDEPDRLFHDLRRSGVRNLVRAGVPESVAMRISGSVFERYNIINGRDLHDAARKLENYIAQREAQAGAGHNLGTIREPSGDLQGDQPSKLLN